MRRSSIQLLAIASWCVAGNVVAQPADKSFEIEAIRALLSAQQTAWNDGDYEGFMDGYWRSDSLTFVSNGALNRGWQTTLDNYRRRYPDRAAMGRLNFTLYKIELLSKNDAFVFGRFELERETDRPTGLFTLLLRKFQDDWKVVFDHTSTIHE